MAKKPERFSQDEIRRETISPEEMETWVRYVKMEKYEAVKKAGLQISEDDIRIIVRLKFLKDDMDCAVNANISVETLRPGGYSSIYIIAPFAYVSEAKESFYNYARFKNANIVERDTDFMGKRDIEVSV